ncbi:MAG: prepilin-type N-terminal cleavage/methylation domain-containing protein [Gammaproteobacteria bacterium]|jgi:type IV fimbrial biogenesis protein FimT|nr:prepilin-type N-terminal cleavage/methylation domain-containing protein [Gammaproteobacteria bacterium]MBT4145519.1 prepilin-type N-terminal cleavage/methylation domain-containing protein [Gammaproteobacteria bacterium]MBT5223265.1 prepilin-type N-terminal cleavage/methylation domain-containing protein [Gammaproteobacteria bacterium]MBT5824719.1 prepilin-type N-terminal cleavage/methylation domain-containing protein [Gammaproteobacteria bacterium]MBT5967510.1 prepilin-type N-terminal cleavag
MYKHNSGFTLMELMVTLSIAGIVASIGIPSFSASITSSRVTTMTNEFITALRFARSEAVKRNQNVVVSKSGAQWEAGWQVFVDNDKSNAFSTGDELLKEYSSLANGYTLKGDEGVFVSYNSRGEAQAKQRFILCAKSAPVARTSKLIIINAVGRSAVADDTDSDGIPNDPDDDNANIASCTP